MTKLYFHVRHSLLFSLCCDLRSFISVIACKPTFPPYLSALLPQDQIFDPEDLEYDHKAQEEQPPKKRLKSERRTSEVKTENSDNEQQSAAMIKQEENTSSNWDIDNPYLAATKLPNKGSE